MSISTTPLESETPVFDVVVTLAAGITTTEVERLAIQFNELSKVQIEGLLRAFQNGPKVKVGDHVTKDRADKAKQRFEKIGLIVSIVPMLSLQAKPAGDFDGRFLCRACNNRVDLPDNRKCPSCGMFVDKITDEWLLKKKIMEQERAKLNLQINRDNKAMEKANQKSLEDAIRAKIREELEEEYGIKNKSGLFSGKQGLVRVAGLLSLVTAAFVGGGMTPAGLLPWSKPTQTSTSNSSAQVGVDKMLNTVGSASGGDKATGTAEDSDMDDPSIQALTGGKKMGGQGLTIEQAIAASRTLAASVGNTTYDRATGGSSTAVGEDVAAASNTPVSINAQTKHVLAGDYARELAELGQWRRARAIVKSLKPLAVDNVSKVALQGADLEAQAWSIQRLTDSKARLAIDSLIEDAKQLADPADRARALGAVAVIISNHVQLPTDASHAFLALSNDALKTVSDAKTRSSATDELTVSMGQVFLNEVTHLARTGNFAKALPVADQLGTLANNASGASAKARLHALDYQSHIAMGRTDTANQSLKASFSAAGDVPDVVERAALFRKLASIFGSATLAPMQDVLTTLRKQMESKPSLNNPFAYAHLSLMFADFGMRAQADENHQFAVKTKGMTPVEANALQADLITRGDMAAARLLHINGQYSASETILQRISGYLL